MSYGVPENRNGGKTQGEPIEEHLVRRGRLKKCIRRRDGTIVETDCGEEQKGTMSSAKLHAVADKRYLLREDLPGAWSEKDVVRIADLFSGVGSLTLGAFEAARVLGMRAELVLAADIDPAPLEVMRETFGVGMGVAHQVDLGRVLSSGRGKQTKLETELLGKEPEDLDILLAGPPCQGHSRLNNHTRHDDPRNDLYGRVVRLIELRRPRLCLIENVDSVVNDQRESASKAAERLEGIGYAVDEGRISLHELGVAQKRKRHVLVATDTGEQSLEVEAVIKAHSVERVEGRDLRWAIGDLVSSERAEGFDAPSVPSEENRKRIRWLHGESSRYDLPNSRRPDCHRFSKRDEDGSEKQHSYKAMYGKLDWSKPAQTITSGYGSMGQGRYVHPSRPRTLTPHEAARLQFIPDFVRFDAVEGRGKWARMIGNVAPMKLSYAFTLEFLR